MFRKTPLYSGSLRLNGTLGPIDMKKNEKVKNKILVLLFFQCYQNLTLLLFINIVDFDAEVITIC